jgi:hypothetical protein
VALAGAFGATAVLDVSPARTDGVTARLAWRGADARGAFAGATREAAWTVTAAESESTGSSPAVRYALHVATRRGALIERCVQALRTRCELRWASDGGDLARVGVHDDLVDALHGTVPLFGALATPDGGALVALTLHAADANAAANTDVLLRLGPDGAVRARRNFTWRTAGRTARVRALGLRDGAAGYVFEERDDDAPPQLFPADVPAPTASVALPPLPAVVATPCGPAAADAVALVAPLDVGNTSVRDAAGRLLLDTRGLFELSSAGLCLRAVTEWRSGLSPPAARTEANDGLTLRSDEHGAMVGAIGTGASRQALRCAAPAP